MSGNETKYREKDSSQTAQTASECGFLEVQIVTWKVGMEAASFYVQAKGSKAGRPLASPIPNCWAVYSDLPHLRQIAYSIYKSRLLSTMRVGSVIPFIRLREYRRVLLKAADLHAAYDPKSLEVLTLIDERIDLMRQQLQNLAKYQAALAFKINSELQIFPKP